MLDRQKRNSAYSIRAYAKDLGISPAFMNQVLNGRRSLSEEKAHTISNKLKLKKKVNQAFLAGVRLHNIKDPEVKSRYLADLERQLGPNHKFNPLEVDKFKFMSDWYHLAILELSRLKTFKLDVNWIAKKLGLASHNVREALERLQRLNLLDGKATSNSVQDIPSSAIRSFHRQMLHKAIHALEGQTHKQRHISGITIAINPKKYTEALKKIEEFRKEMNHLLGEGDKSKLYHLSIQFFQLDQGDKNV